MRVLAQTIAAASALAIASPVFAAPPVVTSVYPQSHRINAGVNTIVEVHFSEPIDPASVTDISFRVFGRWSGPAAGTTVVNGGTITFTPTEPFFAGEWVTVNLSKAIENLDGENIVKGYAWNFWIETADGNLTLSYDGRINCRQGGETWVQVYGAHGGDLNNDGWSDLTVPCEQTDDARVYLNNSGTFSAVGMVPEALEDGNIPSPNDGGDFDNNGEIDLVVGNTGNNKASILFGDGSGSFPNALKTSHTCGSTIRGVGVVDLNGDGWDDFVTANRFGNNMSIVLNNGDGTFAPSVAKESGGNAEYSIAIADANNDGLLDVFCGTFDTPYYMIVLLSDGNGGLTAQTPVAQGGRPWQTVAGDFNNDGNVDVASCNSNTNTVAIHFGNGSGGLGATISVACDNFPLAIDTGDIDGDGDLELVTSNYTGGTWNIFSNTNGVFGGKKTLNASSAGSCVVLHDRDNDGDLDLTGLDEIDDFLYFWENVGSASGVPNPAAPSSMALFQNHPNPFNPSTLLRFQLDKDANVSLDVYDAAGAYVTTLASGPYVRGTYEARWDGTDARGTRVGSGVYFARLAGSGATVTRKMVLLK